MDQYNQKMNNYIDQGALQVQVISKDNQLPVQHAQVEIASSGLPNETLEIIHTDANGGTGNIFLESPPIEYSMEPVEQQPYSEYNLKITAEGFQEVFLSGVQILPNEIAIQQIALTSSNTIQPTYNPIVISGHTLWEYYPPKIAEDEIKQVSETGEIVLSRVVVPETIIVHDGAPTDSSAKNYYVPFKEYIKNVASCEIYATWPEQTLIANIHAITSFTLNRVYTEWYRNQYIFCIDPVCLEYLS